MKLSKGTLKDIEIWVIKKILKGNENVPFFKDYFRGKITGFLSKKYKKSISEKEFNDLNFSTRSRCIKAESYMYDLIWNNNNPLISKILSICKSHDDFELLIYNRTVFDLLRHAEKEKLEFAFNNLSINNIQEFIDYFSDKRLMWLLYSNNDIRKIPSLKELLSVNNYILYNQYLLDPKKYMFSVTSEWSVVLNSIIHRMKSKQTIWLNQVQNDMVQDVFQNITSWLEVVDSNEREKNWQRINDFQALNSNKKLLKITDSLPIDKSKHELAVYIRYWCTVDYPEVAESIVIFLKKYIEAWFSKYFSWIRILPKENDRSISQWIFDEKTRLFNYFWDEFKASHLFASFFYLSHSTVINPWNTPWIHSLSSKHNDWFNVVSEIELESDYSIKWFEKLNGLNSILREVMNNIQSLETELDKIGYFDVYNVFLVINNVKKSILKALKKLRTN